MNIKIIILFILIIGTNISLGKLSGYDYIKKLSESFKPLPLMYSEQIKEKAGYDEVMNILLGKKRNGKGLLKSQDALLIMTADGDYTIFKYSGPDNITVLPIPRKMLINKFQDIEDRYKRVWIVLIDSKLGWQAIPPTKFASKMNKDYIRIELSMPLYLLDKSLKIGSTNSWIQQSGILKKVLDLSSRHSNSKTFLKLGQIYNRLGLPKKAVQVYQKGIKLFPKDPFLHRSLAECYYWKLSPPRYEDSIEENKLTNQYYKKKNKKPFYPAMFNIALAYSALGELMKAQLQFNNILHTLKEYPDPYWESQTHRYLAELFIKSEKYDEALLQYKLDIRLKSHSIFSSYNDALNIYELQKNYKEYATMLKEYFYKCGSDDYNAIIKYSAYLNTLNPSVELTNAIVSAQSWIKKKPEILEKIKSNVNWWNAWTNITLKHGFSPVP